MLPLLHDIKTVTNVKLFYLNINDIKQEFQADESLKINFEKVIAETRASMVIMRAFHIQQDNAYRDPVITNINQPTFISFKGGKLDPKTLDLHKGWQGYSMISFLMLRKTLRPDSRLIYVYVQFHAFVAFMSAILYPSLFILECIVPWYGVLLLSIPWDLLCLIDVCVRTLERLE